MPQSTNQRSMLSHDNFEYRKLLTCIKHFPEFSWRIVDFRSVGKSGRYVATHSKTIKSLEVIDDIHGCFVRLVECQKILLHSDLVSGVTLENALSQIRKLMDKENDFDVVSRRGVMDY